MQQYYVATVYKLMDICSVPSGVHQIGAKL